MKDSTVHAAPQVTDGTAGKDGACAYPSGPAVAAPDIVDSTGRPVTAAAQKHGAASALDGLS